MVRHTGAWTRAEAAAFLADATVPLRLACRTPSGRLWQVALWFRHREDRFECATSARADVVRFLRADPDVAFDVSTNEPPYRGVRGHGTATVDPDGGRELLADLLERYLGGTDSRLARRLLADDREEVRVVVDPDRVHAWDYTGRMADAVG